MREQLVALIRVTLATPESSLKVVGGRKDYRAELAFGMSPHTHLSLRDNDGYFPFPAEQIEAAVDDFLMIVNDTGET
jgi:hypothetical protein